MNIPMAYAYKTFILVEIEGYPGDIPMHHALVLRYCFCSFHIQLLCSFMLVCCIKQRPILLGGRAFEGIGVTRANDLFIVVIGFRAVCFSRYKSPMGWLATLANKWPHMVSSVRYGVTLPTGSDLAVKKGVHTLTR